MPCTHCHHAALPVRPTHGRRARCAAAIVVAAGLALVTAACAPRQAPRDEADAAAAPRFANLILVTVDALRADHLAAYGYHRQTSPVLDRLAGAGVQLPAYSATSWTRPSTATLLSGFYPQRHQANHRDQALPPATPYLAEILAAAGRSTGAVICNGNVGADFGFDRGFERFVELGGAGKPDAPEEIDAALRLIAELAPPFFAYLHLIDPHDPYVPEEYWSDSPFFGQGRQSFVQPQQVLRREIPASDEAMARMRDQYDAEILELDRELGRFLAALESSGALRDTLVVVSSDHGEEFGEHAGVVHGHTLYEESVAVPLILWSADGRLPHRASDQPVHHVDLAPTLLEALGVAAPPAMDGRSRWRGLCSGSYRSPSQLLLHLEVDSYSKLGLRCGDRKYVLDRRTGLAELFDLGDDPGERSPAGRLGFLGRRRMRAEAERLDAELRARAYPPVTTTISAETEANLRVLGYVE